MKRRLEQESKDEIQVTNKHMKGAVITHENSIKTIMKYHYRPPRMTKIRDDKFKIDGNMEEMKSSIVTLDSFSIKINIPLPYGLATPHQCIYPRGMRMHACENI
jgi:hypothetical protein